MLQLLVYIGYIFVIGIVIINGFQIRSRRKNCGTNEWSMKWIFGKGPGRLQDIGGVGTQGEYYFIPNKSATLKAPPQALGKERVISLFPRGNVLGLMGEENLNVYEMRYRQLLYDAGDDGTFGHIYYNSDVTKIALVGTLTRLMKADRLDDGGVCVTMGAVGRYYVKKILREKPYIRANVQIFDDYTENAAIADTVEQLVLDELRYSVKLMKLLYPENSYFIHDAVLQNHQRILPKDSRIVSTKDPMAEVQRQSRFSFAAVEMLKTDPATKLSMLQESVIEKRLSKLHKSLLESTAYLEAEVKKRGLFSNENLPRMREELLDDISDLDTAPVASWGAPETFANDDWRMAPTLLQ